LNQSHYFIYRLRTLTLARPKTITDKQPPLNYSATEKFLYRRLLNKEFIRGNRIWEADHV